MLIYCNIYVLQTNRVVFFFFKVLAGKKLTQENIKWFTNILKKKKKTVRKKRSNSLMNLMTKLTLG